LGQLIDEMNLENREPVVLQDADLMIALLATFNIASIAASNSKMMTRKETT
jgi:hypothetical protein